MVSSAHDLCKWSEGLHSGRVFNTTPLRAKELLQLMRGLYVLDENGDSYYGYGIKTHIRNDQVVFWHEGLVTGVSVYLEYEPKTRTHVIVLSNNGYIAFSAQTGEYILKEADSNL
jgi:CubicO group peptidase (beta-lactamase class C family)